MRAVHFFEIIYLANIVCRKTCLSLRYLICIRIFQKSVLLYFHSFHWHVQNAMIPCRSQEPLPFLPVIYFFLPPFSTDYSSILPHFILPFLSWSTSQLLLFPNSCIILFLVFYLLLLLLYSYTVHLVKHFSNRGCAFEIHVVMKHKSSDMTLYVQVHTTVGPNSITVRVFFLYTMCVCKLLHGMPYFLDSA